MFALASCLKDYDFDKVKFADWNPEIAAPLVSSKLTMADVLENSEGYLLEDPQSGQIYLVYESQATTGVLEDYLVIPDQFLNTEENFSMPPFLPGDTFILAYSQNYPMNLPGGERLDSLEMRGHFDLHITSNINHSGIIEVKLPFFRCDGSSLEIILDHNYTGTLPVIIDHSIDLNGCVLIPQTIDTLSNVLNPEYRLILYGDSNAMANPYTISMNESLRDVEFVRAFGYLNSRQESLSDTLMIDAFNGTTFGGIAIDSVILKLEVRNSFGLPVRLIPNNLWAYSAINFPYKFNIADLPDFFEIQSPSISQVGEAAISHITIRSGDIATAINNAPNKFYYDFSGALNPDGSTGSNFLLDTSRIDVDVQIEVPLSGAISELILQDTVDFDLSSIEELEAAGFRVHIENTFPFEVAFQAYLLDTNGILLDSLFNGYDLIIASGSVGPAPDLRVLAPGRQTTDIQFSGNRMDHLLRTEKLILKGRMRTANGERVRIYGDAALQVQIGANAKLNVSLN